jgi:hypothetical protein
MLFIATFLWMSLPLNNELDIATQKWVAASNILLKGKKKPTSDEVIFIDVSKSRYLHPLNGDSSENEAIVNRKYLTEVLQIIKQNNNSVKYVFADLLFSSSTDDDKLLSNAIKGLGNKFLCINAYTEDEGYTTNSLKAPAATASLTTQEGDIYKIPFFGAYNDTLVPYKIYYNLFNIEIFQNPWFSWFKHKGLAFNSQINNYTIRSKDFIDGGYTKIGLGELVSLLKVSPEIYSQFLENRFILIGDFENDIHSTYFNDQPGTLILYNAFLHLEYGNHILSFFYLVTLYIFLYFITWLHTSKWTYDLNFKLKIRFFKPFLISVNIISISILIILFYFYFVIDIRCEY